LENFTPLPAFLTDEYMNDHREPSPLLQAAVIHSQFEMIHPFDGGNGRVGRLIIPLYLYSTKTIPFPTFFISRYFAANDLEYKKNLFILSKTDSEIPAEFLKQTHLPKSAVYNTLRQLETAGYIVRTGSDRKSRFVFQKLLDVI